MITIVDAPCGHGKSTWAINEINRNTDKKYVVCTPLLDEIDRFLKLCEKRKMKQPFNYGHGKHGDFDRLLSEGENIAVTHSTFMNSTQKTIDIIRNGKYHLILDETIDILKEYNQTTIASFDKNKTVTKQDICLLSDQKLIEVDPETYRVSWPGKSYPNSSYSGVEIMAKTGQLYLINDTLLVCELPPEIFDAFESVYVLTYLFKGSQMHAYFEKYGLEYEIVSTKKIAEKEYELCEYNLDNEIDFKEMLKKNVTIESNPKMNFKENFSKAWFHKNYKSDKAAALK